MGIMKYSRLGDTFYEDKAKKINQALEKINAPYYQVCKKVRGSRANKDVFDISWRKRNITCDTDYPNATTTSEKVVMKQLEKNFGISLTLLNTDTLRAIKKSLDYQKAQQTILDNKIKAKEERERAAAARKEARTMAKNNKSSKTTTTKSIPSSERNDNKTDNKESANRTNEILTEKKENITYFYAIVKNGRRKNYAKLNTLTNRVQYLSSSVPIYVKEVIKSFKATKVKELPKVESKKTEIKKSSTAKSTKAVEEKKESKMKDVDIKDIGNSIEYELDQTGYEYKKENETNTTVYYKLYNIMPELVGEIIIRKYADADEFRITSKMVDIKGKIDDKSAINYDIPLKKDYEDSSEFKSAFNSITIRLDKTNQVLRELATSKSTPKEEKKEDTSKATDKLQEIAKYIIDKGKEENIQVSQMKKEYNYIPLKVYKFENYVGEIRLYLDDVNNSGKFMFRAYIAGDDMPFSTIDTDYNNLTTSNNINMRLNNIFREYHKESSKIDKLKYENKQNEMKPINEPETTEIIKEPAPIMIDEDEAAKFDKGLDELTKLLQQAMQG